MGLPNVLDNSSSLEQKKPGFKELDLGSPLARPTTSNSGTGGGILVLVGVSHYEEVNATTSPAITMPEKLRYGSGDLNRKGVIGDRFPLKLHWDLECLGNKEQLVEDQKLGEDDPLEVEVDVFYSGDESDIEGERKRNLRKLRKDHANDGGNITTASSISAA
ncbi:hypothetical protein L6452_02792 [Arctium lappa]|uniref:Uncharacterized protein n=1 Tax=Arctium lappa TaxID=4217 RepID=A0ACB9FLN5_ARCLA|nr:hypothetical protein L6452_02792 [Arctium lappa]